MRIHYLLSGGALAVASVCATTAWAQEEGQPYFNQHVEAPANAFEISVGTGYTQGFGNMRPGTSVNDVQSAGIGFDLGLGYRVNPYWGIGVNGQYQEYESQRGTGTRGLQFGLNAQWHFLPYTHIDPWLSFGVGYRMFWETNDDPTPSFFRQGFQLARLQLGADWRIAPAVALGPVIGADLNMMLWEKPSNGSNVALSSANFNTFIFAGLQGRFDVGATYVGAPAPVTASR